MFPPSVFFKHWHSDKYIKLHNGQSMYLVDEKTGTCQYKFIERKMDLLEYFGYECRVSSNLRQYKIR